jgi:aldehyde reductase
VIESADMRMTSIPLSHGVGHMPALGFGTLIPDAAVKIGIPGFIPQGRRT